MAVCVVENTFVLGENLILTPERYHPGRKLAISFEDFTPITEFVEIVSTTLTTKEVKKCNPSITIVNTGDAYEGYIRGNIEIQKKINSTKKKVLPGDIIISRLRPYLRQVAFVDRNLKNIHDENHIYACSTEFFVLRSKNKESIAFLTAFLLSDEVQRVFQNSVEGSQHPRFKEEDLLNLVIPNSIVKDKKLLSEKVEKSLEYLRAYEKGIQETINLNNLILNKGINNFYE